MEFGYNQTVIPTEEISIEGFQVVSGEYFNHSARKSESTCTLWPTAINFSKLAVSTLNNCERVRVEVNPEKKGILITPVTANDKDGIRWTKNVKEPVAKRIECKGFASQLYEMWGWDLNYAYRTSGKVVTSNGKVLLLFDFNEPENWKFNKNSEEKK